MVKERPIIFSAEMVRAILDGRKSQTRRVVRPQPPADTAGFFQCDEPEWWMDHGPVYTLDNLAGRTEFRCPYGQPGDRLWVRETFWGASCSCQDQCGEYRSYWGRYIEYAEQRSEEGWKDGDQYSGCYMRRRPAIHMPRWASRITLEITNVRVERVRDISEEDAEAEGLWRGRARRHLWWLNATHCRLFEPFRSHTAAFAELWSSIHGPDSWSANPWVWVIAFRRLTPSSTS